MRGPIHPGFAKPDFCGRASRWSAFGASLPNAVMACYRSLPTTGDHHLRRGRVRPAMRGMALTEPGRLHHVQPLL